MNLRAEQSLQQAVAAVMSAVDQAAHPSRYSVTGFGQPWHGWLPLVCDLERDINGDCGLGMWQERLRTILLLHVSDIY